jgi:hypothetical protein
LFIHYSLHFHSKLLTSILTKKQLNDKKAAIGSGFKKQKPKKPEEAKVVIRSKSPEVIPIQDDSDSESAGSDNANAMNDLLDLNCVTCRQMDSSANNQLFECIESHLLIHQLCHVPKISNESLHGEKS